MDSVTLQAKTCGDLLEDYEKSKKIYRIRKLKFPGMDDLDVYNVSIPLGERHGGYIAGRVEPRTSEVSKVVVFRKEGCVCRSLCPPVIFPMLQDPFFTFVGDEIVMGGVQLEVSPRNREKIVNYRTVFYRGKTIRDLRAFAEGPVCMKDIRMVQLPDGTIGVFTRPQGNEAGKGKIGFTRLERLEDLNADNLRRAEIVDSFFSGEEWGGVNDVHLLKNGLLGIIGHIAYMTRGGVRHYFPVAFAFNPETLEHTPLKILCRRPDVLEERAKRPDLWDVLFPGGVVRKGERADLYIGVSDAAAQCVEIDDPFLEYEA